MIKRELDIDADPANQTFFAKDVSSMKNERVGTSHFAKRL